MSRNVPANGPVTTNDYQRMLLKPGQNATFQQRQPIHAAMEAGESKSFRVEIHHSTILRYLKTQLRCTTTRFEYQNPKVVLGFIKTGTVQHVIPIQSITHITTGKRFNPVALFGFIFLLLLTLGSIQFPPLFLIFMFWTIRVLSFIYTAHLHVSNSSGQITHIAASIYAADRLEHFANELKSRTFTDWGAVRHEEHQQVQIAQLEMQRMMLQQQIELQQQLLNSMQMATHTHPSIQESPTSQPPTPLGHVTVTSFGGMNEETVSTSIQPAGSAPAGSAPRSPDVRATSAPLATQPQPDRNPALFAQAIQTVNANQTRLPAPPSRFLGH